MFTLTYSKLATMFSKSPTLFGALLLVVGLGSSAVAQNHYILDDGIPNSGLSYGLPTDYCWFQYFTTVGPTDLITNVQVMFQPGMIPDQTPITLCVWEDPNDDGDPADAILVAQVPGVVPAVGGYAFTTYAVANPATVHGKFFVGAYLTTDGSFGTISLLDYDTALSGHAYFATDAPGFFDPSQLSSSFYNHIEVLGAGIHGVFMLRADGSGTSPIAYCAAKLNSAGCTPQIGSFGFPSATSGAGFFVQASSVINRKQGILLYGMNGRASTAFFGGTLCLATPILRTPPQNSGGTSTGINCTGVYSFDFNAWNVSGAGPHLPVGTLVDAQYYSRDPGFAAPNSVGLSNALEFTLLP